MTIDLSYSAIRQYLECPLRFKFVYVERRACKITPALLLGTSVHGAIEAINRSEQEYLEVSASETSLQAPFAMNAGDATSLFTTCFGKELDSYMKAVEEGCAEPISAAGTKSLMERGISAVLNFLELQDKDRPDPPAQTWVEQEFKFPLSETGQSIKGYVDKIVRTRRGKYVVIDYKTGREYTQKDVDNDLQLSFYYHYLRQGFGVDADELALVFLETCKILRTRREPATSEIINELISSTQAFIEAELFDPRPGRACPNCEFKCECPKIILTMSQVKQFIRCPRQYELKDLSKASNGDVTQNKLSPALNLYAVVSDRIDQILTGPADSNEVTKSAEATGAEEQMVRSFVDALNRAGTLKELDPYFTADLGTIAISGRLGYVVETGTGKREMLVPRTGKDPKRMYEEERLSNALILLMAREKLGLDLTSIKNLYLRTGTVQEYEPSRQDLKDAVQLVKNIAVSIKRSQFKPRKGPLCSWCDVEASCAS